MKKLFYLSVLFLFVGLITSCSDNDPLPTGIVSLKIKSSGSNTIITSGRISTGRSNAAIVITDFRLSIRDVSFKNEDDANPEFDTLDITLRGPYQLDLLNDADALTQTIGDVVVPNGTYKELRFKLHKDEDLPATNPLFDRSIFIAGTIDDVPFEMFHDTSENLDVGKSTGITVAGGTVNITVNFTIDQFLSSLNQIDLADAVDGNQDGLIEINPNDPDGNKALADLLKENIKEAADLLNE